MTSGSPNRFTALNRLAASETWERFSGNGPFGFGFSATDPYPRGYHLLTGYHVVGLDPDGTRHLLANDGTEQDICELVG